VIEQWRKHYNTIKPHSARDRGVGLIQHTVLEGEMIFGRHDKMCIRETRCWARLDDWLRNREILNRCGKKFLGDVNQSKKPAMPGPFRLARSIKNRKKHGSGQKPRQGTKI
jgi:hypothetical protein